MKIMKALACTASIAQMAGAEYRFPEVNSEELLADPLSVPRLEAIHELIKEWPSETAWDHDTDIADEF